MKMASKKFPDRVVEDGQCFNKSHYDIALSRQSRLEHVRFGLLERCRGPPIEAQVLRHGNDDIKLKKKWKYILIATVALFGK